MIAYGEIIPATLAPHCLHRDKKAENFQPRQLSSSNLPDTSPKKGWETPDVCSLDLLGIMELFLLPTYLQFWRNDEIVAIEGMGTILKGRPHECYHGKAGRV